MPPQKKKPVGRPRLTPRELPIYDSRKDMANKTDIPLAVIQAVSDKRGSKFVNHGRCSLKQFLVEFFNQDSKDIDIDYDKLCKKSKSILLDVEVKMALHKAIDFDEADHFIFELVNVAFFGELDRLANEFPPGMKGKTEIEINEECLAQIEKVKHNLLSMLKKWASKYKKQAAKQKGDDDEDK